MIVIGCAALIYIQPLAQKRLKELGYEVPILHPFKCAIEMAKALVNLKVSQSKFAFPSMAPRKKFYSAVYSAVMLTYEPAGDKIVRGTCFGFDIRISELCLAPARPG